MKPYRSLVRPSLWLCALYLILVLAKGYGLDPSRRISQYGHTVWRTQDGLRVVVNGPVRPLHPVVFEEVSKIGKEALGNAFRHSGAHSIEAELNYEQSELRIRIRDIGTGIDSAILRQGHRDGHFGLPGMRERAQKIGAHLDVWSRAEAGTEIELRIPARIAYVSEVKDSWLSRLRPLGHRTEREEDPHEKEHARL